MAIQYHKLHRRFGKFRGISCCIAVISASRSLVIESAYPNYPRLLNVQEVAGVPAVNS